MDSKGKCNGLQMPDDIKETNTEDLDVPAIKITNVNGRLSDCHMRENKKCCNFFDLLRRIFRWSRGSDGHVNSETSDGDACRDIDQFIICDESTLAGTECDTSNRGELQVKIIADYMLPDGMKETAMDLAVSATKTFTRDTEKAKFMKAKFDSLYGSGWNCVVGASFSASYFFKFGHFVELKVGESKFLLFISRNGP